MSKEPQREEEPDESAFERFEKLAKALFRVDKRDVPKHEPKKRVKETIQRPPISDKA
jgi:hypothetical protein